MNKIIFTKRKANTPNLEYLNIDTSDARTLRGNLKSKRFQEVDTFLNNQSDTNNRTYYLEVAADWKTTPNFLTEWFEVQSSSSKIVSAIHSAKMAWNLSNWTHGKSDAQRFKQEVAKCQSSFSQLAADYPRDASFYFWYMWIAKAMYKPDLARQLLKDAMLRDPSNISNASNSISTESGHWFGSPDTLIDYSKSLIQTLPKGVGASSLILEAYCLNAYSTGPEMWADPQTRSDILNANQMCSEEGLTGIIGARAHHWLAWGLTQINEPALAKPHFNSLHGAAPEAPWGSLRFGLDAIFSSYKSAKKKAINS